MKVNMGSEESVDYLDGLMGNVQEDGKMAGQTEKLYWFIVLLLGIPLL